MLIVRSPVRISFGGGGTDLPAYFNAFGGGVLSAAIDKYFYTLVSRRTDGKIQVISSDLKVTETWEDIRETPVDTTQLGIVLSTLKHMDRHFGADLFLASEIPPGTGLGSSASVCVNILKAISEICHVPLSRYDLAATAYTIAHDVLKKPVGKQDEYAASFGGLNYIHFHPDDSVTVEPLVTEPDTIQQLQDNLMLFFTGVSHDSWSILKQQDKDTRTSGSKSLDALHNIKQNGLRMRSALEQGNLQDFGSMLDEAWQQKKQVTQGISSERIDHLYSLARASGALGGKITGAGGGGFLLLYCEAEHQPRVRAAFAAEGISEMMFKFDFVGAQLLVDDPFLDADQQGGRMWRFVPAEVS
jgi:D-glycero-alpha-D-manno-heptose-7-phosphate kinase